MMADLVEKWKMAARRDDVLNIMVPSDVRELVGEIEQLQSAAWAVIDIEGGTNMIVLEDWEKEGPWQILLRLLPPRG